MAALTNHCNRHSEATRIVLKSTMPTRLNSASLFAGIPTFSPFYSEQNVFSSLSCSHFSGNSTIVGLLIVGLLLLALVILNHRKKSIISKSLKTQTETESCYRLFFEHSPIPLMKEDLSTVKIFLDQLQAQGILDFNRYFADNPESLNHCATMVRIIDANRAALTLYKAETPSSLSQRTILLPEDKNLPFKNELLGLMENGNYISIITNKTLSGDILTVERRTMIATGFEHSWGTVFITTIDITEQRRLMDENKSFKKHLQQSQRLATLGNLATGIAHDFNNILAPIMGRAELMLLENATNQPLHDHCHGIIGAARRGRNMVKQILIFNQQVAQEMKPVSLTETIQEVIGLVRPTLPATIEITCNLPDQGSQVLADSTQLHQVIMNLTLNAFHAMEDKGGCLRFQLETVTLGIDESDTLSISSGQYHQLTIQDSGHGMDQAIISKIFEPYFTTKPCGKGTGLGLPMVRSILRSSSGAIRVQSEVGKGTLCTLYFPVAELSTAQMPVLDYSNRGELPQGTEHILLVDDNKSIADVTTGMLERLGYKVTGHISSVDALETFRNLSNQIDLLIADLTMPQMTGLQLYREVRKIRPDVKVLICTGSREQLDSRNAEFTGIQGFLPKPVILSDLARCVRSTLDS